MKNKWGIAFGVCFVLLVSVGIYGLYSIINQDVTISYMQESYTDTEADLETLIEIVGKTDQTKYRVEQALKDHRLYEYMDFKSDTIGLERINLIFENDTLKSIEKQW